MRIATILAIRARTNTVLALSRVHWVMPLFIAEHEHNGDRCPAHDPKMGEMLLQHLSQSNAKKQGITLLAEAVETGNHRLVLIADAADAETVQKYMAPFAQAGSVNVLPASTCEAVVERRGC